MTRPILTAACCLLLALPAAEAGGRKGRKMTVVSTAYCGRCDPSRKTATGRAFGKPGIAVDPRVIPLGSLVIVPGYNGGRAVVADDTGGAIKGRKIDVRLVRLANRGRCARVWGKRKVTIRVVRRGRR